MILHATRSGQNYDQEQEFNGTINYVRSGGGGLGWSCTAGPGLLAIHMEPTEYGWNAREHSSHYLAIEFAQAQLGGAISDDTVEAAAYWIREYALAAWPGLPMSFPMHSELPAGIRDGKTDAYERNSFGAETFRQRLRAAL